MKSPTIARGLPELKWTPKSAVKFPQGQVSGPGTPPCSLDKDLESLPIPSGGISVLSLQPRLHALRLGLSLIVDVRKFISLPRAPAEKPSVK